MAFRDRVDAAEVADLARIRKKRKLCQLEAGRLAGGGKNAFSRYERGQAKPVAAVMNIYRLLDVHQRARTGARQSRKRFFLVERLLPISIGRKMPNLDQHRE